jgi:hypothetical protein
MGRNICPPKPKSPIVGEIFIEIKRKTLRFLRQKALLVQPDGNVPRQTHVLKEQIKLSFQDVFVYVYCITQGVAIGLK